MPFTITTQSHPHLFAALSIAVAFADDHRPEDQRHEFVGNEFGEFQVDLAAAESQAAGASFAAVVRMATHEAAELGEDEVAQLRELNVVLEAVFP